MDEQPELELRHYLHVLRRRFPVVVLVMVLAVGAALAFDFTSTRIYSASAEVLLTTASSQTIFNNGQTTVDSVDVPTQVTVMESSPIKSTVNRRLGADAGKVSSVSIAQVGLTNVIDATVESPDPAVAKRAADLYAQTYVATRRSQDVDSLLAAGNEVQKKLTQIQGQINALPPTAGTDRTTLASEYDVFKQQLDQIQANAAVQSGGAQVVGPAQVPTSPVKPQPIRDAALAGVLGLLLGVGLAFLAEYLDDKIHTTDDVGRYGHGLTVLAEVPAVAGWRDRKTTRVVSIRDSDSSAAEAYRSLRTSLQIIGLRRPVQTILVTSPMTSEGKTTTAVNLAVTMARAGRHVVLVDLDLRRPRIAQFFGLDPAPGFTSVLVGDAPLSEALARVSVAASVPVVQVLTSGPIPPNPSELVGTTRVSELLASIVSFADLVIIDSPPLIPVTDALVLAGRVDGVLLVVGAGQTRRRHLGRATDLLQQAEAPILGAVLNATTAQHRGYGYGYGGYAYREGNGSQPKALSRR
jgi:succinoglycan biosynthesis transport protein ExoP